MLLATKFLRPAPDPRAIDRSRISSRLDRRPGKRLVTVTAPAGYGKTTLVSQWCDRQRETVAWLSLDTNDDEPHRFWQYVAGSLESQGVVDLSETHGRIADLRDHELAGAITSLLNTLATTDDAVTLVIDDYHLILNNEIHRQLSYLVDYLSPNVMLVLISRTEPPLPLARWRVRHWLEEIHAADLAFSESECHRFFTDYMGLSLSEDQAQRIWQRTEGWVAAMQLAGLAGGAGEDTGSVENAISYSGDSKYISDYVLSEILEHQTPELRRFLLDTSCCPRISGPLCDAIRESQDSQAILEQLVAANLFIIPLNMQGQWYRYHDLFREALFNRLQLTDPDRLQQLQNRAIQWFLDHDQVQEAIGQLIELKDWEWLGDVLAKQGNNLIHSGLHLPVMSWLDSLPAELVEARPRLLMLRIWALFFSNKLETLEPLLERLEGTLDRRVAQSHPDAEGALALESEIDLMRAYLARTQSDLKRADALTQRVLRDIDHTNIPLKSVTYYGIGLDCYAKGDLVSARSALQASIEHGRDEKKPSTVLSSGGLLAWILFHQGEMDAALDLCSSVRAWVDGYHDPTQPRLVSCWQNSSLAQIYREKNDLELAHGYMTPLLDHLRQGTEPGQHIIIQHTRAHLAFSEGNHLQAIEYLEDAERILSHKRDAIVFEPPCLGALKARCYLAQRDFDKARAWLDNLGQEAYQNPLNKEQSQITAARVMIALDQPDEAVAVLAPLRLAAEQGQHYKHLIELLAVYASALEHSGQHDNALVMIQRALQLASRDRFLRLFAEESPTVAALILAVEHNNLPDSYFSSLLALTESSTQMASDTGDSPAASSGESRRQALAALVEPLSQRELEVLELINEGLANKEIANRLDVAPTTIKAHIRNLYGKIGARSRTEALAKARQMGVL